LQAGNQARRRILAPRARFELAIRRGELTATQQLAPNPFTPLSGFKFSFPVHRGSPGGNRFGVKQAPRSRVTLCVKRQSAFGVAVLGHTQIQMGGLTDIGFAFGI
jgi:hypothetical protein